MKEITITADELTVDLLDRTSHYLYNSDFGELTRSSQFQVTMMAALSIVDSLITGDEKVKVFFNLSEEDKDLNIDKYLLAFKKEGRLWLDKESVESFFDTTIKEDELDSIEQRTVKIPTGLTFSHPLSEFINSKGEVIPRETIDFNDKKLVKELSFNSWGSASVLVDAILNPDLTIDKKATLAIKSFKKLLSTYSDIDKEGIQELIEGIKSRNLASCVDSCCFLSDCIEIAQKQNEK